MKMLFQHTDNAERRSNSEMYRISRMLPDRIFMFLINLPSGNVRIQKLIAKHIFECFEKRKGGDGKVNTQGLLRLN